MSDVFRELRNALLIRNVIARVAGTPSLSPATLEKDAVLASIRAELEAKAPDTGEKKVK